MPVSRMPQAVTITTGARISWIVLPAVSMFTGTPAVASAPASRLADLDVHLDHSGAPEQLEGLRAVREPLDPVGEQPLGPSRPSGFGAGQVTHAGLEVLPAGVDRAHHDLVAEHEADIERIGG